MQNLISTRRVVAIFLALHTATILVLAFIVVKGGASSASPLAVAAGIVVALVTTLYTAYRIIQSINEKIEGRAKSLTKYAQHLQTKTAALEDYAGELKQWASDMNEQQHIIQRRVDLINRYGNKMLELVAAMDEADANG